MYSEFRWRRKDCNDVIETRLSGSAFPILAAATGKSSAADRRTSVTI